MFKLISTSLLSVLFANQAFAYTPPSGYVVKSIAQKRHGYKGFKITETVTALENDQPTSVRFKDVTWYDTSDRNLLSRAYDESGKEMYSIQRRSNDRSNSFAGVVDELLLTDDTRALSTSLVGLGLPIRTESELLKLHTEEERRAAEQSRLARLKTATSATVAWVYGDPAKKSDPTAELWVEKDTFLPIRLIALLDSHRVDIGFENYRFFKEFPYPRSIRVLRSGGPSLRAEVVELLVNPDLSEVKADQKRGTASSGLTDAGRAADGHVRDLIQAYYETLR